MDWAGAAEEFWRWKALAEDVRVAPWGMVWGGWYG